MIDFSHITRWVGTTTSMLFASWALVACGFGGGHPPADPVLDAIRTVPTQRLNPFDAGSGAAPVVCPATSHPFSTMLCSTGDANGPINLIKDYGYVEKEFFQSGRANVYDLGADDRAQVSTSGHPYTTRLLVRYPNDPARFSGRVFIDILNASSGVDLEDIWRRSWKHLMLSGDAYIGITSQSLTADALKKFDPVRYADINWKVNGVNENGLVWDMLSQLGTQLRTPGTGGLLATLSPKWVYLGGQSQSGFYMNAYLSAFADRLEQAGPKGKPLFDGYLNLAGPGTMPLRSEKGVPAASVPKSLYKATGVPQIVLMSEAESRFYDALGNGVPGRYPAMAPYQRRADANRAGDKFRFYEVAGAPHSDPTSPIIPINSEIAKAKADGGSRAPKQYFSGHEEPVLQLDEFVSGALENLHAWAAKGIPAPPADTRWLRYATSLDAKGKLLHAPVPDPLGNAQGGLRSPLIEAPLYQYLGRGKSADGKFAGDWGSMVRLSDAAINALYGGNCNAYLTRFDAAADALVTQRYLLERDAQNLKRLGRALASQSTALHPAVAWTSQPCR
jgi:hypothetical protein